MRLNFCTLFDSNYLLKGVAMYESLKKWCSNFHLYIFAFDDKALRTLRKLKLSNVTIIPLLEFEGRGLLAVKSTRTKAEYCWTCTPSTIWYVINKYHLNHCTYLDADIFFYASPEILIKELGSDSVLITEHRYTPLYDQTKTSGKYCVQFITFKNTAEGRKVLKWWRKACLEWCYSRFEDNKFGDQKYLDDWLERFTGVSILENLGGGAAPWNVQQYKFAKRGPAIVGAENTTGKAFFLVFYHFHKMELFSIFGGIKYLPTYGYEIGNSIDKIIYGPYIKTLTSIRKKIKKMDPKIDTDFSGLCDYVCRYLHNRAFLAKHYIKQLI